MDKLCELLNQKMYTVAPINVQYLRVEDPEESDSLSKIIEGAIKYYGLMPYADGNIFRKYDLFTCLVPCDYTDPKWAHSLFVLHGMLPKGEPMAFLINRFVKWTLTETKTEGCFGWKSTMCCISKKQVTDGYWKSSVSFVLPVGNIECSAPTAIDVFGRSNLANVLMDLTDSLNSAKTMSKEFLHNSNLYCLCNRFEKRAEFSMEMDRKGVYYNGDSIDVDNRKPIEFLSLGDGKVIYLNNVERFRRKSKVTKAMKYGLYDHIWMAEVSEEAKQLMNKYEVEYLPFSLILKEYNITSFSEKVALSRESGYKADVTNTFSGVKLM